MTAPTPPSDAARQRTETCLASLDPRTRPLAKALLSLAMMRGWPLAITEGRRTEAYQASLYAKGRTAPGPGASPEKPLGNTVTKAATARDSAHGWGLAFDVCFLIDGKIIGPRPGVANDSYDSALPWKELARVARDQLGLVPGASFGESSKGALDGWDPGHFELPRWRTLTASSVAPT